MAARWPLLTIIVNLIFIFHWANANVRTNKSRLLIISLDGFAHEYLKRYSFQTIKRIQSEGVQAVNGMQPTFATMTYPNHISIATGMYQEDHGIIHNRFYDTQLNKTVTFDTRDEGQWSDPKVEPIWITATKQNKKTAVLYWPAGSNTFDGVRPLINTPKYSNSIPFQEKIDKAISYFLQNKVEFVMIYHYEPDKQGHDYGPNAKETYQALLRLDNDLDYLFTRVRQDLHGDINIIILSDHGMTSTLKLIQPFREGYINVSTVQPNCLDGALFSVTPHAEYFEEVTNGLRRIPNVTVYKRDEFPERFHYAKAVNRVGEIIVLPNEEGTIFSKQLHAHSAGKGNHGFDNTLPSMQAIFMAWGPDFNQHTEISTLKNVDVYHIACKILNIKPNPYARAGSLSNLTGIFRSATNVCSKSVINIVVVIFLVILRFIIEF